MVDNLIWGLEIDPSPIKMAKALGESKKFSNYKAALGRSIPFVNESRERALSSRGSSLGQQWGSKFGRRAYDKIKRRSGTAELILSGQMMREMRNILKHTATIMKMGPPSGRSARIGNTQNSGSTAAGVRPRPFIGMDAKAADQYHQEIADETNAKFRELSRRMGFS